MSRTHVTIVYYSATGHVHALAEAVARGAEQHGAEVRLRRVAELAPPDVVARRPAWAAHLEATDDIPTATADDLLWADAIVMGTPTRFGNVSSQLKQFLDTLGPAWAGGQLADRVYSGFTSTDTEHGGQESTLLALYNTFHHFGGIVVAPGYTQDEKSYEANPYGSGHVSRGGRVPVDARAVDAARHQGARVARVASALRAGDFSVR